jgi:hypothetical protein
MSDKSLQESAIPTEQLAHHALVGLLQYFIHKETAYALVNGIRD